MVLPLILTAVFTSITIITIAVAVVRDQLLRRRLRAQAAEGVVELHGPPIASDDPPKSALYVSEVKVDVHNRPFRLFRLVMPDDPECPPGGWTIKPHASCFVGLDAAS